VGAALLGGVSCVESGEGRLIDLNLVEARCESHVPYKRGHRSAG
jgi:hypothetical protein